MGMKDWNGPGMPEEMKQAEDTQRNKMGQGSLKGMKCVKEAQNSVSTSPTIVLGYWNCAEGKCTVGLKEAQQAQVKRKHGRNNGETWQRCQPTHKEGKGWIEEGKAHAQARPSPGRKQIIKNENPVTYPRHKRSKMSSRTCSKDQTSP